MKRALSIVLLAPLLALVAHTATGGPWPTFESRRVVSASGRTYAVVRADGTHVGLAIYRRRGDAAPLATVIPRPGQANPPSIDADPEDELLSSTRLGPPPIEVLVSDEPPGVLLVGTHGRIGHGQVLRFVGGHGEIAWAYALSDLLTAQEFTSLPPGTHWRRGVCLHEPTKTAYVASLQGTLVRVPLGGGSPERVGSRVLLDLLGVGSPADRELVLELVREHGVQGCREQVEALASDERQPLGVRVRAAVVARSEGGTHDYADLFGRAVSVEADEAVRLAALDRIAATLGFDAFEVIVGSIQAPYPGDGSLHRAVKALASLGITQLPKLDVLRQVPDGPAAHTLRSLAHRTLRALDTPEAHNLLFDSLEHAGPVAAQECCTLLVDARPPALAQRLRKARRVGSAASDSISRYFRQTISPRGGGGAK